MIVRTTYKLIIKCIVILTIIHYLLFINACTEGDERKNSKISHSGSGEKIKVETIHKSSFERTHFYAEGFSWRVALNLLYASELAYSNEKEIKNTCINKWNFNECYFIRESDTELFLAVDEELILIAFRGTSEIEDWVRDLQLLGKKKSYGTVHKGFYSGFSQVRSNIEELLVSLSAAEKKIFITGHSLGGALAAIAAAEWKDRFPIKAVYTFGQPAVGNVEFKAYMLDFSEKFYRVVNNKDVIARIPPNYMHIGLLKHINAKGKLSVVSLVGNESASLKNNILNEADFIKLQQSLEKNTKNIANEGFIPMIKDHSSIEYIDKVLALINSQNMKNQEAHEKN